MQRLYRYRYALLAVLLVLGLLAGCEAAAQFFSPGPDGTSPADTTAAGGAAIAAILPPPWNLIVPGALGTLATAGGWVARQRGRKLKQIAPAFEGVVASIDAWKDDHPEAWEDLGKLLESALEDEDVEAVDHFRAGKPNSAALRGV